MTIKLNTWNKIIKNIESRLTETEYKTWFSNIYLDKYDKNVAFIKVPNKFIADWLKENYLDKIIISFKTILKRTPEIQFIYNRNYPLKLAPVSSINENNDTHKILNSAMRFDNFSDPVQSQSGSFDSGAVGVINALKFFKDYILIFWTDTNSLVTDFNDEAFYGCG